MRQAGRPPLPGKRRPADLRRLPPEPLAQPVCGEGRKPPSTAFGCRRFQSRSGLRIRGGVPESSLRLRLRCLGASGMISRDCRPGWGQGERQGRQVSLLSRVARVGNTDFTAS